MGWHSAEPRKAWKESVTWTWVCQLLLGQECVPGTELALPHPFIQWGPCPAPSLSTGSCPFPDTGFTAQQLNSLRTGVFPPLTLKLFLFALSKGSAHSGHCFGGAHRNLGFAVDSKFNYCFEVITVINTKSTGTQMHFPAFLIFGSSLGLRQSSCRSGSFSFSLHLVFRTWEPFLLLSCTFSLSQLVLKPTFFRIKASPVSCTWCLSQILQSLWSLHLQFPATVFHYSLSCQVASSSLQSYPGPHLMISS